MDLTAQSSSLDQAMPYEALTSPAKAQPKTEQMVKLRISATVADAYTSACPGGIPENVRSEGLHVVSLTVARLMHDDALRLGDPRYGPQGMPLATRIGYSALARQIRSAILKSSREKSS